MDDEIEGLSVVFEADMGDVGGTPGQFEDVFGAIEDAASSASENISSSMTKAADSFDTIDAAMAEMSAMTREGALEAGVSLDDLGMAGEVAGEKLKVGLEESDAGFADLEDAVSSLVGSINSAVGEIDSRLESIGTTAEESASVSKEAFSGFDLGGMINSVGMGIFSLQAIGQMATQTASSFLGPAATAEQMSGSLAVFTGSAEKAKQEMDDLSVAASHSPFKTTDVDQFALKLQSVGVAAQDVIPDFVAMGDGLDAVGRTSSADLAQLTDAFVKIQTEGHLSTETMNSFAAMGIDAWSVLEKQTGKTHETLQAYISKGLYGAKDAMHDLTVGMEANPLYHGQMANDASVFNGVLSTLQSNWEQLLADFGSPIIKGLEPVLGGISDTLSSPAFKDFAENVGQGIVNTFKDIGDFASQDVVPAVSAIGGTIHDDVLPPVDSFIKYLQSPDFGQFAGTVGDIAQNVENSLKPALNTGEIALQGVEGVIGDIWPPIEHDLVPAIDHLSTVISPLVSGLIDWINESGFLQYAFQDLGFVLSGAIDIVSGLIDGVSTIIGWFEDWGNQTQQTQHVLSGFSNVLNDISGVFGQTTDQTKKSSDDMKNNTIQNALDTQIETVKHYDDMRQQIINELSQTKDESKKQALQQQLDQVNNAENTAKDVVQHTASMHHDVVDQHQNMSKDIKNTTTSSTTDTKNQWQQAVQSVEGTWHWLYDHNYYFRDLASVIKRDTIVGVKGIEDEWNGLGNDIVQIWNNIVNNGQSLGRQLAVQIAVGIAEASVDIYKELNDIGQNIISGAGFHGSPAPATNKKVGHARGIIGNPVGHWAMVGEEGPEPMFVPAGASIFPNGSLGSLSSGTGLANFAQQTPLQGSSSGGVMQLELHVHIGDREIVSTTMVDLMMEQVVRRLRLQGGTMLGV